MGRFLKQAVCVFLIIMFLPYIITLFFNGDGVFRSTKADSPYVTVEQEGTEKEIALDEYGIRVLAKEIDGDVSLETLKAQAILIRTSIYKKIQEEGSSVVLTKGYWSRQQMESNWGSDHYAEYYEKMKRAWEETEGSVLMYEGSLALTPYHKVSNGKTRSGQEVLGSDAYPYLQVKECPADIEAPDAMTTSIIQETGFQVQEQDSAGYVTKVLCGTEEIQGEEFRDTYHLPSASFVLQDFDGKTRVLTQGIGHGLGMSQYTAEKMAEDGKTYEEILSYFFEGTTIEEVAEILVKPE